MAEPNEERPKSSEACPACGAFTLALIDFPEVHSTGYLPANEIMGMGERTENTPPAIGCLTCGTEWRDLVTFQAARDGGADLGTRFASDVADGSDEADPSDEAEWFEEGDGSDGVDDGETHDGAAADAGQREA